MRYSLPVFAIHHTVKDARLPNTHHAWKLWAREGRAVFFFNAQWVNGTAGKDKKKKEQPNNGGVSNEIPSFLSIKWSEQVLEKKAFTEVVCLHCLGISSSSLVFFCFFGGRIGNKTWAKRYFSEISDDVRRPENCRSLRENVTNNIHYMYTYTQRYILK